MSEAVRSLGGDWVPEDLEAEPKRPEIHAEPLVRDYVVAPLPASFDWPRILEQAQERNGLPVDHKFYLVGFRSTRKESADGEFLTKLDEEVHAEASSAPGYVMYFKGGMDENGNCLSFCLWESAEAGHSASRLPKHQEAVGHTLDFYSTYVLEMMSVRSDGQGAVEFADDNQFLIKS